MRTDLPVMGTGPAGAVAASVIQQAGYVWDNNNLYVKDHETAFMELEKLIKVTGMQTDAGIK